MASAGRTALLDVGVLVGLALLVGRVECNFQRSLLERRLARTCCDKCGPKKFCSTGSWGCYDTKKKDYYLDCSAVSTEVGTTCPTEVARQHAGQSWGCMVAPVADEGRMICVRDEKAYSAQDCKGICDKTPGCNSFAYTANKKWCWLYDKIVSSDSELLAHPPWAIQTFFRHNSSDADADAPSWSPDAWNDTELVLADEGKGLGALNFREHTVEECKRACEEMCGCNSFAYTANDGHCMFKAKIVQGSEPQRDSGWGYKTYYRVETTARTMPKAQPLPLPAPTLPSPVQPPSKRTTASALPACDETGWIQLEADTNYTYSGGKLPSCSMRGAKNARILVTGERLDFTSSQPIRLEGPETGGEYPVIIEAPPAAAEWWKAGRVSKGCVAVGRNTHLTMAGDIEFSGCRGEYGGAILADQKGAALVFLHGFVTFKHCHSNNWGGAVQAIDADIVFARAHVEFFNCSGQKGAGIHETGGRVQIGPGSPRLTFSRCKADFGGGMSVDELNVHDGSLVFRHIGAGGGRGALVTNVLRLDGGDLTFDHCHGWALNPSALEVKKQLIADNNTDGASISFQNTDSPLGTVGDWSRYKVGKQSCPDQRHFVIKDGVMNCVRHPCVYGSYSFKPPSTVSPEECKRCSDQNITATIGGKHPTCEGHWVEMPRGTMATVDAGGLAYFRCPNDHACPGGVVRARLGGETTIESKNMCSAQFDAGEGGCVACRKGFGRTEKDPFRCVKCDVWPYLGMAYSLLPPILLFLLQARSVTQINSRDDDANCIINMILSFGTMLFLLMPVPGMIIGDETADDGSWASSVNAGEKELVEVAMGSWIPSPNMDCWLSSLFVSEVSLATILVVQVGIVIAYVIVFMLGLFCWRGRDWPTIHQQLAIWINTCLPGIFGGCLKCVTIFVTRRGQPSQLSWQLGVEFYGMGSPHAKIVALGCCLALVCLVGGVGYLYMLITKWSRAWDDEVRDQKLAFLIRFYKKDWRESYEIFVLVRKMLLIGAAVLFPASYSPGLFLTSLLIIVMGALVLLVACKPYRQGLAEGSDQKKEELEDIEVHKRQVSFLVTSASDQDEEEPGRCAFCRTDRMKVEKIELRSLFLSCFMLALLIQSTFGPWRQDRIWGQTLLYLAMAMCSLLMLINFALLLVEFLRRDMVQRQAEKFSTQFAELQEILSTEEDYDDDDDDDDSKDPDGSSE